MIILHPTPKPKPTTVRLILGEPAAERVVTCPRPELAVEYYADKLTQHF